MSLTTVDLAERLAGIRDAFDRSFAEPPKPPAERTEDLLAIRVAGNPYAIRVAAIAGLYVDRAVIGVPGPVPELLGVAGFRGSVVAVYDLGALLGFAPSAAPRSLVLAAGTPPVGLAFDGVDGHLRVPATAIAEATPDDPSGHSARPGAREVVRTPDGTRPVVGLHEVRAALAARIPTADPSRKRQP